MTRKFTIYIFFICSLFLSPNTFAQQGTWTWMKGGSEFLFPGNYGTKGVPDPANGPPAMYSPTRWTDLDGNFWLYGGFGPNEYLGDLWKFDPVQNMWTWVKGNKQVNQPGVYGTQGVPSPTNFPGCRGWAVASWTDVNGDLWLFGGKGHGDDPNKATMLADLWRYNIANNEWTWMKGNGDDFVHYGTKLVSDDDNTPGKRQEMTANWTDNDGGLWFFGGLSNGILKSDRSDMWRYDININEWTWMSGDSTMNLFPVMGAPYHFSPANTPGGRFTYCSWQDKSGMFWFFGGHSDFYGGNWCDLWQYDPEINQWAFVNGSITNTDGVAGPFCDTSQAFYPQGRWENRARWIDDCGNLWLFGGQRNSNSLNDLWMFNPEKKVWSFVSGTLQINNDGEYGVKGVPDPDNMPGSRCGAGSWIDNDGNLWLFGGAQTTSHETLRGDLWRYTPDPACPALACKKLSAPGDDTYDISIEGLTNAWIQDLNKSRTADDLQSTEDYPIKLYPNPTDGSFTIEFSCTNSPDEHSAEESSAGKMSFIICPDFSIPETVRINMSNAVGQLIYSAEKTFSGPHFREEIKLVSMPAGIYFIELKMLNASFRNKIILSR